MRWFRFFFNHSFFIAVCAFALSCETYFLLALKVNKSVCLVVFFATLFSYNSYLLLGNYFAKAKSHSIPSAISILLNSMWDGLLIVLSGMAVLYLLQSLSYLIPGLLLAGLLTIIYFLPLIPWFNKRSIRKYGLTKPLLLAGTWAFVTVYLPVAGNASVSGVKIILLLLTRFLFVFLLSIIFDMRDIAVDKIAGMKTIATEVSQSVINYVVIFSISTYLILLWVMYGYWISASQAIALLVVGLIALILYSYSSKPKGYYFYYVGVDGLMLLSAFAVYLATI